MPAGLSTDLFWPVAAFLLATAAALAIRALALAAVRRWGSSHRAALAVEDILRVPSVFWCVVFGLSVGLEVPDLPPRTAILLNTLLQIAVIVSVTITVASLLGSMIARAGDRLGGAVSGLVQTSTRLLVLLVGGLVLLSSLGIHITPILTALGVGGLAVALALQDTLSNLFSGMHLLADRPIRVGDYVKVAETEGFVVDVGWRSTRIRTLLNTVVVVPNRTVAQSMITNYDLPESRMTLVLKFSVGYASDPDHVERVLVEEANAGVGTIHGLLADPAPFARLIPGFGDSSVDWSLMCQVASFVDQYPVQHELRKRVLRRFRAEGIEMPYPVRAVELRPPA